jgi:glycosyltransferase involved in cell wall biosynthesis
MPYASLTDTVEQQPPSTKTIRILHVVGSMNAGGVETWLMHMLRFMDPNRFRMDFLVHTTQPCFYDDEIRSLGGKIIPCLSPSKPWLYDRNLKQVLREHGPYDIVHSQLYFFDGFVVRAAKQEKIPVIISHIHPLTDVKNNSFARAAYQWLMSKSIAKYSTHLLFPSRNTSDKFRSICDISGKYTDILHNGVELSRFRKEVDKNAVRKKFDLPINKLIVIYVARFDHSKNHAQMLRIADSIDRDKIGLHFVIVGSNGPLLESLKEQVNNRSNISMLSGIKDISDILNAADLFFFPSLEEGFGVVAIEAAAAGLPIVATCLPTIQEACPLSHHTFMFPPNDDEIACQNIMTILQDDELRKRLSTDAKKWSSNFSIEKSVEKLTSIYEQAISR